MIIADSAFVLLPIVFWFAFARNRNPIVCYFTFLGINLLLSLWLGLMISLSLSRLIIVCLEIVFLIYLIQIQFFKNVKYDVQSIKRKEPIFNFILLGIGSIFLYLLGRKKIDLFFSDYDANSQHLMILHTLLQNDSIRDVPQFGWAQALPALSHYFTSIIYTISPTPASIHFAITIFCLGFIYISIHMVDELLYPKRDIENEGNSLIEKHKLKRILILKSLLKISFAFSYPMIKIGGYFGTDLVSQLYLLLFFYIVLKRHTIKKFEKLDYLILVISIGCAVATKVFAIYQIVGVALFFLIYLLWERNFKETIFLMSLGVFGGMLGSVFFLRNLLDFRNPFYPYSWNSLINFDAYIVSQDFANQGAINANLPKVLIDSNKLEIFYHYWVYSIYNWAKGYYGLLRDFFAQKDLDFSFDLKIYGMSFSLHLYVFIGIILLLLPGLMRDKYKFLPLFAGGLLSWFLMPLGVATRFFLALTVFIVLSVFLSTRKFWLSWIGLVLVFGGAVATISAVPVALRAAALTDRPIYKEIDGNLEILSIKCPEVVFIDIPPKTLLKKDGFASAPLLGQMCTKVYTEDGAPKDNLNLLYFHRLQSRQAPEACLPKNGYLIRRDIYKDVYYLFTRADCSIG
jgi:hypothetical protein